MNNDPLTKLLMKQCNLMEPEPIKADDSLSLLLLKQHRPEEYAALQGYNEITAPPAGSPQQRAVLQKTLLLSDEMTDVVMKNCTSEQITDFIANNVSVAKQLMLRSKVSKSKIDDINSMIEPDKQISVEKARKMSIGDLLIYLAMNHK